MSQHLITDFINRTYVFKPFYGGGIINHSIKKTNGTNRKNHISPEIFIKNAHSSHTKEVDKDTSLNKDEKDHIDIII